MAVSPFGLLGQGTRLGRYTLLDKIGAGGMGELYVAELAGAADFRKLVVIKRLLPHLADDPTFESLFFNEARIAAGLSHPNVCHVYELDRADDQYFIAMEYLEGATLGELCRDYGAGRLAADWSVSLVASLVYQFSEGLHHVHELSGAAGEPLGIVHRDVSPSNLFITSDGVGKVLDFGIAKIRAAVANPQSGLKGKFAYMSPEQLCGESLDRRSDVFGLAVVLYEALTGRALFDQKGDALVAMAILEGQTRGPAEVRGDVPPALDAVVRRGLEVSPDRRFATARDFGEAVIDSVGGSAIPPGRIAAALASAMVPHVVRRRRAFVGRPAVSAPSPERILDRPSGARQRSPFLAFDAVAPVITLTARPDPYEEGEASAQGNSVPVPRTQDRRGRPPRVSRRIGTALLTLIGVAGAAAVIWRGVHARWSDEGSDPLAPDAVVSERARSQPTGSASESTSRAVTGPTPGAPEAAIHSAEPDAPSAPAPARRARGPASGASAPPERPGRPRVRPARDKRTRAQRGAGYLSIASTPYATIWVDGRSIGDTPIYRLELPAGTHNVRAITGDRSQTMRITVVAGEVTTRRIHW